MRLNKYLAHSGLGSRRAVEQLILDGQVSVNGQVARELATQVEPGRDSVFVAGKPVQPAVEFTYIMLNKPRGYDVTRGGRHHHRRAWDLLPKGTHPSVQSVGRLDRNSTGLLLFTNDGELAFRLAHPRHGCRKVYLAELEGTIGEESLRRLTGGIELEDGPARALEAERWPEAVKGQSRLRIVMGEGRKHIVRRMCEAVGHPVLNLERTAVDGLEIGELPRGKTRFLTGREVNRLRQSVGLPPVAPRPKREASR
jgi:23S rRNA pseudouridine2605 synthase